MKPNRNGTKWLLFTAAFLLSLCLCVGALAETGTIFPWLTYTLDVALVSTDPDTVGVQDAPDDGVMVMVQLVPLSGTIQTDDIQASCEEIRFRAGDGDEFEPYSWRVRGVGFDASSGMFSTNPEQTAFEMLYFLQGKQAEALSGAKLLVPTGVKGETILVPLDKAPRSTGEEQASGDDAAPEDTGTVDAAAGDASFTLGGIRYTIASIEDEPSFVPPNRMDGKEGHLVTFTYAESGTVAEDANGMLYSGAKVIQPNGDAVVPYCNSDNIGNPYELYFGLSDGVLLSDCDFSIEADNGEVKIPLSGLAGDTAQSAENGPAAAEEPAAEPSPTPDADSQAEAEATSEPLAERAENTFTLTVGGAAYELALDSVAYDSEEKQMGVDVILYDHELLDFVSNKQLVMPFGCGIISTKDGFLYNEGITATMSTPMHLIFYFDTKNVPDLVCFGKLNDKSYADSEDFALVDPTTKAYVTTFPLTALSKNEKDPEKLLDAVTSGESEPAVAEATVQPTATPVPSVAVSEAADETERSIADVLSRCAQGVKDEWQLAIYRAGVKNVQADPAAEGVYTFLLRSFDPGLKALGKYQDDNRDGYLARLLENTRAYNLSVSLTLKDGAFTDKSVKALQSAVKKAAAASLKAFKDKRVLSAFADELFFTNFASGIKNADMLYAITTEYVGWLTDHSSLFSEDDALQWVPFFYGQVKRTLDVTGGPFALKLKCTSVDMSVLLAEARADALRALMFLDYDHRWDNNHVESEFRWALADNVIAMKKKGKQATTVTLNVDGSPIYDSAYSDMLGAYPYADELDTLKSDTEDLPDEAAQSFPKAGWMSGSTRGTQVRIKAPKDSAAYYVQLRDYDTDEIAVSGFVRPGTTCTLRLPKGNYYFVMASGSVWYGEEKLFGEDTEFTKTGLFEVYNSNYYHTVTLKVVENGNMPIYGADEEDLR